jgi:hypothetical protein
MSDYLLRQRVLNPPPQQNRALATLIKRMLERRFDALLKLLLAGWEKNLPIRRRLQQRPVDAGEASSLHTQESQHACRSQVLENCVAPAKVRRAAAQTGTAEEKHAAFLVKAPLATTYFPSATSSSLMQDVGNSHASGCLAGLCVLCVGGRAALYPSYRSLIEGSGARFLIYRGDRHDADGHLPALLLRADAVICPVDCVNHASFFHVKQHCMRFNKPCALLERSSLPAFRKGIEMLVAANLQV